MTTTRVLSHNDYTVGWVCAVPVETAAAKTMLDDIHEDLSVPAHDHNSYTLGRIGKHNVVIACLPSGSYGNTSATAVTTQLLATFRSIRFGLMVGIGGGVPNEDADIRLGDVVVSKPTGNYGGVVQYDLGKALSGQFERTGVLNQPPPVLLRALSKLQANHMIEESQVPRILSELETKLGPRASTFARPKQEDRLFRAEYEHVGQQSKCVLCDGTKTVPRAPRPNNEPVIHYGLIASGNSVIKSSDIRDFLSRELRIYCVEMEAAGLMNDFPCLVIRGICDYADSHKNDDWQGYAAAASAAFAKELLLVVSPNSVDNTQNTREVLSDLAKFSVPLDLSKVPTIDEFVGRNEDVTRLWSRLEPSASAMRKVVVLHGLGGIGKTQLAIRFARLHQNDFAAIFWLNGKDKETLMRSLAGLLPKLPGVSVEADLKTEEKIEQAAQEVLQWLAIPGNSRWLLIYDNIDKYSAADDLESEHYDVTKLFPSADHGSIIVTSRLPQVAEVGQSYPVQKLQPDEAVTLLIKSAGLPADVPDSLSPISSDIITLAERLDGLPLALVIAGSYIRQTGTSPSRYLALYTESWKDLQQYARPHRAYFNGNLVGTWMISYQEIQKNAPAAAQLLLLLAYYANQDIWYELVHQGLQAENPPPWLVDVATNEISFSRAIQALLSFSLVQAKHASDSYSLHPVVQDWCLGYVQDKGMEHEMRAIAIVSVGNSMVNPQEPQYWILQQRLLPHADRILQMVQDMELFSVPDFDILGAVLDIGALYLSQGKVQEAEKVFQRALAGYERALGPDHAFTLQLVHNLGMIYGPQGRLQEAEQMYQRALAGLEKALGPDEVSTLQTVYSLACFYQDQGKLQEAEEMYQRALTGLEKAVGPDHVLALQTVDKLASLYQVQGRLQEAEKMLQRALTGFMRTVGLGHVSALQTVSDLAVLYKSQGRLQETEEMYQQALATFMKDLGADHPLTLQILCSLGILYSDQMKLQEAEEMLQQALAGFMVALGPNHPSTMQTFHGLGLLYIRQGKPQEAEEMLQQGLDGLMVTLGPDHPVTLQTLYGLGTIYMNHRTPQEAEKMLQRALAGFMKTFGPDHDSTLQVIEALRLLSNRKDSQKAQTTQEQQNDQ